MSRMEAPRCGITVGVMELKRVARSSRSKKMKRSEILRVAAASYSVAAKFEKKKAVRCIYGYRYPLLKKLHVQDN